MDASRVEQLDWWQSTEASGLRLTATPSQHFSGRGLGDSDRSLWASGDPDDDFRIFFSGDTGYFDGFKAIGEKYGPFDLTMIETGAYDPRWAFVHMQPEQTLQAHLDLRGKWLLPIHNGTFDLALHAWQQPFERITALAAAKNVPVATPMMGEALDMHAAGGYALVGDGGVVTGVTGRHVSQGPLEPSHARLLLKRVQWKSSRLSSGETAGRDAGSIADIKMHRYQLGFRERLLDLRACVTRDIVCGRSLSPESQRQDARQTAAQHCIVTSRLCKTSLKCTEIFSGIGHPIHQREAEFHHQSISDLRSLSISV